MNGRNGSASTAAQVDALLAVLEAQEQQKKQPWPAHGGPIRTLLLDRVSTVRQVGNYSGGEDGFQQADMRRFCAETGRTVVGTISMQESGKKFDSKALTRALNEFARPGLIDEILCHRTSRFARSGAKRVTWTTAYGLLGVRVSYLNIKDTESIEGKLALALHDVVDEVEVLQTAERQDFGRKQKLARGEYVGNGDIPYGYRALYRPAEHDRREVPYALLVWEERLADDGTRVLLGEAAVVGRTFGLARDHSCAEIARILVAEGAVRPLHLIRHGEKRGEPRPNRAARWTAGAVYSILTNPVYKGTATYGRDGNGRRRAEKETGQGVAVPAIVTAEAWGAAQDGLDARRRARRSRVPADRDPYTLRGRLACTGCGGPLAKVPQRGGLYRYYQCLRSKPNLCRKYGWGPCGLPAVRAEVVEAQAWELLRQVLGNPERLARELEYSRTARDEARGGWLAQLHGANAALREAEGLLGAYEDARAQAFVAGDAERIRTLDGKLAEQSGRVAKQRAETERVRREHPEALRETDERAVLAWSAALGTQLDAEVMKGLEAATAAERHAQIVALHLEGEVSPVGAKGKGKGRGWAVRWRAAVELGRFLDVRDSEGSISMLLALYGTDGHLRFALPPCTPRGAVLP